MHRRTFLACAAALACLSPRSLFAQYGHPLKGQWSGELNLKNDSRRLLLDIHWDGKALTGSINPGGEAAATFRNITVDYANPAAWKVTLEAERKDKAGKTVRIVADATLENIGAYRRLLRGTWTEGGDKGDFTVTRN
jgi:hypothetical protein